MKQITVPKLKAKLDIIFSLRVRERDGFKCQKCGKVQKHNHCAHICSRNNLSVRYELDNAVCLCYYCHLMRAHREPVEFVLWVKNKIGEILFEKLRNQSQIIIDNPREFLEHKKEELANELSTTNPL